MGYPTRRIVPGHLHLAAVQSSSESVLFRTDRDHAMYARLLDRAARRHGVGIDSFVRFEDRVLVVATPSTATGLSNALHDAHATFARSLRRIRGGAGPILRRRPWIVEIPRSRAGETLAIVERTPSRVGLARDPTEFRHGSARAHAIPGAPRPRELTVDALARPNDRRVWHRALRRPDDRTVLERLIERTHRTLWCSRAPRVDLEQPTEAPMAAASPG